MTDLGLMKTETEANPGFRFLIVLSAYLKQASQEYYPY